MQTVKAVIQFMDDFGRMILLTQNNEAVVLYNVRTNGHKKGDEITLTREIGEKRWTDWREFLGDNYPNLGQELKKESPDGK